MEEEHKLRAHLCMALTGGCFGAYAILRFGRFASAITVNLIEIFTGAAQGDLQKSLLRLCTAAVYVLSLFLASFLPGRLDRDLRGWAAALDGLAAVICYLLPEGMEDAGIFLCVFAMAFQWAVFADGRGYPCSTIFSTNNLRQFVDAWVKVRLERQESHRPRMRIYGLTLLFFHMGVLAVCLLWRAGCRREGILISLIPAALTLFWLRSAERAEKAV